MAKSATQNEEDSQEKPQKKKLKLPIGLIIAFFVCFVISVGASSGISYLLSSDTSTEVTAESGSVEEKIKALEAQIAQQQNVINKLEQESDVLRTYLRHSSSTALKNILVNQEEHIQSFLAAMRQGVGDLSDLVPRGTDWANEYQFRIDQALKSSFDRANLLRMLKTGEPPKNTTVQPSTSPPNNDEATTQQ